MTPVQRRIYLLNKKVNQGVQKDKEKRVGWKKVLWLNDQYAKSM